MVAHPTLSARSGRWSWTASLRPRGAHSPAAWRRPLPGGASPPVSWQIRPRACADEGAVTAETALVLPALVIVLVAAVWVVSLAAAQLRCVDAAREAARSLARGDPPQVAAQLAKQVAPTGAVLDVATSDGLLRVSVRATARAPGLLHQLPTVTVTGEAVTVPEGLAGEVSGGGPSGW